MKSVSEITHLRMIRWASHGVGAACLTVIAFAFGRAYCLLAEERVELRQRQHANSLIVSQKRQLEADHHRLDNDVTRLSSRHAELLLQNPSSLHEAEFLALLSRRAEAARITLRDYRQGSIQRRGDAQEMELTVSLSGAYRDFCRFLDDFARLPQVCSIEQLTLASPATWDGPCSVELKIGLIIGKIESGETAGEPR
jgi:Tfp pilus assembly protein PilO